MRPVKPPRLRKKDVIGIVSPASPISDVSKIERGVRYLESLGYRVVVGKHATNVRGYLAGTDDERVSDLHAMFNDKAVRAIICVRGGYGTPRLLPLLNYKMIARAPKILVGFSDITALHLALYKRTGLITFHGPMLGVDMAGRMERFTEEMFWRVLTSARKFGPLPVFQEALRSLWKGSAKGTLLGGNLSLLVSMMGTPYLPGFAGSVAFLEEVNEEPYRVDRMLQHLRNASVLTRTRAVLAGQFRDCVPKEPGTPSLTVDELLEETARDLRKPFLANLPFGHEKRKLTLPIGIMCRVDSVSKSVELMEGAVS